MPAWVTTLEGEWRRERHRETWRETESDSQQNWMIPNTSFIYWSCGPPLSPNICVGGDKAFHEPEFVLTMEPKSAPQNNELLKRLSSFYFYTENSACNKMIADSKKHATSLYKSNFHIKWICHKQSQLQKIEMMSIFFPYSLPSLDVDFFHYYLLYFLKYNYFLILYKNAKSFL